MHSNPTGVDEKKTKMGMTAERKLEETGKQEQQPWVQGVIFDIGGTLKRHSPDYDGGKANAGLLDWLETHLPEHLDRELFLREWKDAWVDTKQKKETNVCGAPERTSRLILRSVFRTLFARDKQLETAVRGLLADPSSLDAENVSSASSSVDEDGKKKEKGKGFTDFGDFIDAALEAYYTYEMQNSELFPGIFQMLDEIKKQGRRMAVVTNAADTAKQRRLMRTLGLDKYFKDDEVIISSEVRHRKPDSRIFRKVLRDTWKEEIPANRCVMVGDMLSRDILGARYCGMLSVLVYREKAVRRNQATFERLGLEADVVIQTMPELPQALLDIDAAARIHQRRQQQQEQEQERKKKKEAEEGKEENGVDGSVDDDLLEEEEEEWPTSVRRNAFEALRKLVIGFGVPKSKLPRMRNSGLFDTRFREDIEYVLVDLEKPLAEQKDLSRLDILVVKVTNLLTRSSYLRDHHAISQLTQMREWMERNPDIPVLGLSDQLLLCIDRWQTLQVLSQMSQPSEARRRSAAAAASAAAGPESLPPTPPPEIPLAPFSLHVPDILLRTEDPSQLLPEQQLQLFDIFSAVRYPVICKSVVACGVPCSHVMVLGTGPEEDSLFPEEERRRRRAELENHLSSPSAVDPHPHHDHQEKEKEKKDDDAFVLQLLRPTDRALYRELQNQVQTHLRTIQEHQTEQTHQGFPGLEEDPERLQALQEVFPVHEQPDHGWVIQEYLKHDGRLFKVYVLGQKTQIMRQSTLPDLGVDSKPRIAVFDTQAVKEITPDWDALVEGIFAPGAEMSDELKAQAQSSVEMDVTPETREDIEYLAGQLLRKLKLDLFGFDVLEACDGSYRVVDINHFPSYSGVEYFAEMFADLVWKKILELQVGRMK